MSDHMKLNTVTDTVSLDTEEQEQCESLQLNTTLTLDSQKDEDLQDVLGGLSNRKSLQLDSLNTPLSVSQEGPLQEQQSSLYFNDRDSSTLPSSPHTDEGLFSDTGSAFNIDSSLLPASPVFTLKRRLFRNKVPSFPEWFNIVYDDDEAVYTYQQLQNDVEQADLVILV